MPSCSPKHNQIKQSSQVPAPEIPEPKFQPKRIPLDTKIMIKKKIPENVSTEKSQPKVRIENLKSEDDETLV